VLTTADGRLACQFRATRRGDRFLALVEPAQSSATEERFQALFARSGLGMALCDMEGRLLEVNEAYCQAVGYSEAEVKELSYWDLTPERYADDEAIQLRSIEENGAYGPYSKHYRHKDGHEVPVQLNGVVVTAADGSPRIWSVVEDQSEALAIQQKMQASLDRFESVAAIADEFLIDLDTDRIITNASERIEEILGLAPAEIIGTSFLNLIVEEERIWIDEWYGSTLAGGVTFKNLELKCRDVAGRVRHLSLNGLPERDDSGNIMGFICAAIDITEERALEEESLRTRAELKLNEERLRLALESSAVGLWDWDVPSGTVTFSDTWFTMLGYAAQSMPGVIDTWTRIVHPDDVGLAQGALQSHFRCEAEVYRFEHRCRRSDGTWAWILDCGRVVEWLDNGEPRRVVGTHVDVSNSVASAMH
jgi:PAS domain S-box-containing protein